MARLRSVQVQFIGPLRLTSRHPERSHSYMNSFLEVLLFRQSPVSWLPLEIFGQIEANTMSSIVINKVILLGTEVVVPALRVLGGAKTSSHSDNDHDTGARGAKKAESETPFWSPFPRNNFQIFYSEASSSA